MKDQDFVRGPKHPNDILFNFPKYFLIYYLETTHTQQIFSNRESQYVQVKTIKGELNLSEVYHFPKISSTWMNKFIIEIQALFNNSKQAALPMPKQL